MKLPKVKIQSPLIFEKQFEQYIAHTEIDGRPQPIYSRPSSDLEALIVDASMTATQFARKSEIGRTVQVFRIDDGSWKCVYQERIEIVVQVKSTVIRFK